MTSNQRSPAPQEIEQDALKEYELGYSAEEYAARFIHEYACWNWDVYIFSNPKLDIWVQELSKFFCLSGLDRIDELRKKYLTDAEICAIEESKKRVDGFLGG